MPSDTRPESVVIVKLDPVGPIELTSLTESFGGLARFYGRHYRRESVQAPKLFVTRLESGSVIVEMTPYAVMFGGILLTMEKANTVAEFAERLYGAIRAFADIPSPSVQEVPATAVLAEPSNDDAADIRAFVRPLVGKAGASLGIKYARYEKRDGEKHVLAEYILDEAALNRAAINIDNALNSNAKLDAPPSVAELPQPTAFREVMLFFDQASQRPGKQKGRTADKGTIPDIWPDPLPIHFLSSLGLKERMVKGDVNPFTSAFVVDVVVLRTKGLPRAYTVTQVHEIIPDNNDNEGSGEEA